MSRLNSSESLQWYGKWTVDGLTLHFFRPRFHNQFLAPAICGQGTAVGRDDKFPVFVGEWNLQTQFNNSLAQWKTLFDIQRYLWATYASGGAFWNIKNLNQDAVDGEGTVQDYWDYMSLLSDGVITTATNSSYC